MVGAKMPEEEKNKNRSIDFLADITDDKPKSPDTPTVDNTIPPSVLSEVEKSVSDEKKTRLDVRTTVVARMLELKVPRTSYSDVIAVLLGIARIGRKTMTVHLNPYPRDPVKDALSVHYATGGPVPEGGPCEWCWENVDHLSVVKFYGHVGTKDTMICDTCIKILKKIIDVKEPGEQYPTLGIGVGTDPPDRPVNQS
jgi:hypothetical protein